MTEEIAGKHVPYVSNRIVLHKEEITLVEHLYSICENVPTLYLYHYNTVHIAENILQCDYVYVSMYLHY